ncbi:Peptidase propeptide and YPEB domain-containing protein [Gracilibacillus orientalis]|uniref:Peptidase propeptide and YPEB domain-containing protein n=1 Tax=Gracilibacillus orientalis TaxID=334253 RepID=A0A1I4HNC6_9BACI|nr:PepSY domain-containing protein [Gracilibacillus orientalis]SFL43041.1 Peptidase propeptide and YPEB domain-containing protein [Gracilibacillus orientalis]
MKNKRFIIILTVIIVIGGVVAIYNFSSNPASAYLSEEEAKEKVSNQFSGEIMELELDEENNRKVYEVEIKGTDRDYELKIDAETGEILLLNEKTDTLKDNSTTKEKTPDDHDNTAQENENETDIKDEQNEETKQQSNNSNNTLISAEEARAIATDQYPGTITDFEQDEDDGTYLYEIEVRTDTHEVDLEIDGYTGSIISISKDDLDDE